MKHVMIPTLMMIPDVLEDVFSLEQMDKTIGEDNTNAVFDALKSINELILVDEETERAEMIQGSHSYNVLELSLSIVKDHTVSNPAYIKEVIKLFHLSEFFVIQDELIA
jgi:hypothetical protein